VFEKSRADSGKGRKKKKNGPSHLSSFPERGGKRTRHNSADLQEKKNRKWEGVTRKKRKDEGEEEAARATSSLCEEGRGGEKKGHSGATLSCRLYGKRKGQGERAPERGKGGGGNKKGDSLHFQSGGKKKRRKGAIPGCRLSHPRIAVERERAEHAPVKRRSGRRGRGGGRRLSSLLSCGRRKKKKEERKKKKKEMIHLYIYLRRKGEKRQ